nr:PREDICTED: uncharacterized protein LOC100142126 isoform X4 [Tribolium castaneum]|eukprot:XP_015839191.1 PREDICTED: uncharacterized protein LOC100142126 isoform X4 [Tribolium castaneum]
MWYEIIPSFLIITVAVAAPHYLAGPFNWLLCGHFYRRSMMDKHEALQYLRDRRLSDPYKIVGLENIPDEEETEDKIFEKLSDRVWNRTQFLALKMASHGPPSDRFLHIAFYHKCFN